MSNTGYMDIDLTGYKDRFGSYITPGRYHVVVDDVENDRSKAGNPMVNLWLRIVSDADGNPTEHDGQTQTDRLTITEKALFRVVGFLTALNGRAPERKNLRVNPGQWTGRHLLVDIREDDPYNGRKKSAVEGYLRFAGAQPTADLTGGSEDIFDAVEEEPETTPLPEAPAEPEQEQTVEERVSEAATVKAPANPQTVALADIDL